MSKEQLIVELRGKYRIVTELGSGGSADVWLALAQGPNGFTKLVVLKTLRSEFLDDSGLVQMFLEEARLAARLNHPNIVQTNEVFLRAGRPVIVMEYLDGVPLSDLLERQAHMGCLSLGMRLRIIADALGGLHAAHELKDFDGTNLSVVHRDVSPHNLLVTFAGQVKVLDFGIAKFSASGDVTETGVIKGKLRYMPPEQINAEHVDRRGDIYSMGVVLWETATGRRMWKDLNEGSVMKRILIGDIPRPSETEASVPPELESIIMKALSLAPDRRYASALEMQTELDEFITTLGKAVRNRHIGREVSSMFEDLREHRAQTIDKRVASAVDSIPPEELTPLAGSRESDGKGNQSSDSNSLPLVGAFFMILAVFAIALAWKTPEDTANSAPQATGSATEAAKPQAHSLPVTQLQKPPSDSVRIRVTAFPGQATLRLDGRLLPSNPYSSSYPLDQQTEHEIVVQAEGFLKERRNLTFDQDQEVVLTLVKKATLDRKPLPVKKKRHLKKTKSLLPESEPLPNPCSPPHYFDERGVKKYKAECL